MYTYREIIFMIFDALKISTDDKAWEYDHVIFLLHKYRAQLLKQRYAHFRKNVPDAYYQTLNIEIDNHFSKKALPQLVDLNGIEIDTFNKDYRIALVSPERFPYVGENKWLKNILYISIWWDGKLRWFLGSPATKYPQGIEIMQMGKTFEVNAESVFEKMYLRAILENPLEEPIFNERLVDPLDVNFPVEMAIVPDLMALVGKELTGSLYLPIDKRNNASDEFAGLGGDKK